MITLTFECPDCGAKLAPVDLLQSATQIVYRKCRKSSCGRRWQLVVQPIIAGEDVQMHKAEFLGISPGIAKVVR